MVPNLGKAELVSRLDGGTEIRTEIWGSAAHVNGGSAESPGGDLSNHRGGLGNPRALEPYTIPEQDADLWECGCVYRENDDRPRPGLRLERRDALLAAFGLNQFTTVDAHKVFGLQTMQGTKDYLERLKRRRMLTLEMAHGRCLWRMT